MKKSYQKDRGKRAMKWNRVPPTEIETAALDPVDEVRRGGPVAGSGPYLIGENGCEYVVRVSR